MTVAPSIGWVQWLLVFMIGFFLYGPQVRWLRAPCACMRARVCVRACVCVRVCASVCVRAAYVLACSRMLLPSLVRRTLN